MTLAPARMFCGEEMSCGDENLPEVGLIGDGAVARGTPDDDVLVFAV